MLCSAFFKFFGFDSHDAPLGTIVANMLPQPARDQVHYCAAGAGGELPADGGEVQHIHEHASFMLQPPLGPQNPRASSTVGCVRFINVVPSQRVTKF